MEEIISLVNQESPSAQLTHQTLLTTLTFDRFLSEFYYDDYPCIRYLWFVSKNTPKHVNRKSFDIYCKILGLQFYIGLSGKTTIQRYNNFKLEETTLVIESYVNRRAILTSTSLPTPFNVLWVESMELETVKQTYQNNIPTPPQKLVPKSHADVDTTYCEYCCYNIHCR